jgi:hypothetical protein
MPKPEPIEPRTDEELTATLRASLALQDHGAESPVFRNALKSALDLVAERERRQQRMMAWALALAIKEWRYIQ